MDQPETWRWIWLAAAVVFAGGELAVAGSFFLAPFALGAAVAALLAFLGVGLLGEWLAFVAVSFGTFAALRPLARRLDEGEPTAGIGSRRLIGQSGNVLEAIPAGLHELGMVRVHREEWRAETAGGEGIEAGALIQVVEQRGTRLIVTRAVDQVSTALPPHPPIADLPKEP
jgi:membrane protein implicated in regulation of membrane protease activity